MPDWVRDSMWWHVYPLGFTGAPHGASGDPEPAHRFAHLEAWLDHVVDLGLNGIALGPIFASSTHGYDTTDHLRVDPRLGTAQDAESFFAACHAKGLRVMLDGVFNHVGREHPAFQAVLEQGAGAETAGWFHLEWSDGDGAGAVPRYRNFEGHDQLVALDHGSEAVVDLVTDAMCHWLDAGADAWRLDAAYAVLPEFWARVLPRVRERHPDVYVVGEVIHGHYADVVTRSGMDAVTQYELWKAVWSGLNDTNFHEIAHALGRHDEFLATFVPWTFVGNHDVTRIASRLTDERHLPHALALLFTVGGTPAVYYGDELAYRGVKEERFGGDDDIRPLFPASPAELSELGADTLAVHRALVGLRRRHRWLHTARPATLHLENDRFAYEVTGEGARLVVALNLADDAAVIPVTGAGEVLAGAARAHDGGVALEAHGWAVLDGGSDGSDGSRAS
ncbi:alpha-amylase family glycosyl hydrolase [Agilicoccus flavus]|uniref:alpha-amylase family glycosyl hydrolase n=1 Tax=Agilicoccus flavus TaxID=2775968 RepID=UPI001CF6AFB2|nr:alpha-amylase family glycosyl hydrolase [Agilicoccus flavus]